MEYEELFGTKPENADESEFDDIETADDYKAYQESTKESVFTRHEDLLKELL